MKKWILRASLVAVLIAVLSLYAYRVAEPHEVTTLPFVEKSVLGALPKEDASGIDTTHLKAGLVPPTNKWFSGVALQKTPKTIFPTPMSFSTTESSFTISLPRIVTSSDTIAGSTTESVTVTIQGAVQYQVTRYDQLSVDLTYSDKTHALGTVTLLAGSPYIQFSSDSSVDLQIDSSTAKPSARAVGVSFASDSRVYSVGAYDGATLSLTSDAAAAHVPRGGLVTLYGEASGEVSDALPRYAGNRITGTNVSYSEKNKDVVTQIAITTHNQKPTLYGFLPHQTGGSPAPLTYNTIYGSQRMVEGALFSFTTPKIDVNDSLDLAGLSKQNKTLLTTTLRRDINATRFTAGDTYFAGKELYRSAQLLNLAKQLGEDDIASTIQAKLRQELTSWLSTERRSTKYFYYDDRMQSIVGKEATFGAQEINDHHFHYGYFIYAASILAKYDDDFLQKYKPQVDLLVADIANYKQSEPLPLRRMFDPYFGHSWASGSAPFDDGNNQESTSEAMNAWIATSLWSQRTNNQALMSESGWMLSNEASATKHYWMNTPTLAEDSSYAHTIVSLNWGGKRDYATFFSADSNAKLGILLLPMSPTMRYQASFGSRISSQVNEALPGANYDVQFGDYLLMYSALGDPVGQLDLAKNLSDQHIDTANSRSYMYAWLMALAQSK